MVQGVGRVGVAVLCSVGVLLATFAGYAGATASDGITPATGSESGEWDAHERYLEHSLVTEPEQLTDEEVRHISNLRESYGLRTDAAFIRSLYSNPSAHQARISLHSLLAGILYTPDEEQQVYRRAAAEWVGAQVDLIAVDHVSNYAGTFIEPTGVVSLRCAPCDPEEVTLLRASLDVDEQYELHAKDVKYSMDELHATAEKLSSDLHARGISHGGSISVERNRTEMFIENSGSDVGIEIPPSVTVEGDFVEETPDVDKNDPIVYGLVIGGQYITGSGTALTSGFAVEGAYGPFILTAGHYAYPSICTGEGDDWFQGGSRLGVMSSACQYGGDADGALISTFGHRVNWGRIHYTSTDWDEPVTFGVSTHSLEGQTVCQTGASTTGMSGDLNTSSRCGNVISTAASSPCGGANPAWTFSLGRASYLRNSGDSGAGVVWPTIYGFGAAGTHSCIGFNSTGAIFSRYSVMANKWGLSLTAS
jgi:hypothetical protein